MGSAIVETVKGTAMTAIDSRAMDDRRYSAIQALKAQVECVSETNPQSIFYDEAGETLFDVTKVQSLCNRWADSAGDVVEQALKLAQAIGADALRLFDADSTTVRSAV